MSKMASDERNFRSSYYEKVGCRGVEEKKSLEILLKEKPWDKMKLKQFCLLFTLPAAYRKIIWKVLLGILPVYTDSHKFVMMQRQQQYYDLVHALRAMRLISNNTQKAQMLLLMHSLETNPFRKPCESQLDQSFAIIAEALLDMNYDDVEAYWLAKGIYAFSKTYEKDIPQLIEHVKKIVKNEDIQLFNHLNELRAFEYLPFAKWFKTCFAGVLDDSSLAKVWDKICACAPKSLLAFVAAVLLITLRWNLLRARDQEYVLKCVNAIPDQTEEVIANKAIEKWQSENMSKK